MSTFTSMDLEQGTKISLKTIRCQGWKVDVLLLKMGAGFVIDWQNIRQRKLNVQLKLNICKSQVQKKCYKMYYLILWKYIKIPQVPNNSIITRGTISGDCLQYLRLQGKPRKVHLLVLLFCPFLLVFL